jgi:hypothetical protein
MDIRLPAQQLGHAVPDQRTGVDDDDVVAQLSHSNPLAT